MNTYNQVDTADLLEELRCHTKRSTAEVLRWTVGEELAVAKATTAALHLEGSRDVRNLSLNFFVIDRLSKQASSDFASLMHAPLHGKPTWAVGEVEDAPDDQQSEEGLEHDREPPAHGSGQEVEAVINPVRNHNATGNQSAGQSDQLAALVRASALGLPGGNRWGHISMTSCEA